MEQSHSSRVLPLATTCETKKLRFPPSALLRYGAFILIVYSTTYVAIDQREASIVPSRFMSYDCYYTFGWPVVAGTHHISESAIANPPEGMDRVESWDFNWGLVLVDIIAVTLIVVCSFVVAHNSRRFKLRRFSVSSLLIAMKIAAVAIIIARYELDLMRRLEHMISSQVGTYYPFSLYPLWLSIPVLCGIACVLTVLGHLLSTSLRRLTGLRR